MSTKLSEHSYERFSVPVEIVTLLKEAEAAAKREDWDRAIKKLRKVLLRLGSQAPEQIRKNLAAVLTNRGVSRANRAAKMIRSQHGFGISRLLNFFQYMGIPRRDSPQYVSGVWRPLNPALADLHEAAQLDPSSEHIRESLWALRRLSSTPIPLLDVQRHKKRDEEPTGLMILIGVAAAIYGPMAMVSKYIRPEGLSSYLYDSSFAEKIVVWYSFAFIGRFWVRLASSVCGDAGLASGALASGALYATADQFSDGGSLTFMLSWFIFYIIFIIIDWRFVRITLWIWVIMLSILLIDPLLPSSNVTASSTTTVPAVEQTPEKQKSVASPESAPAAIETAGTTLTAFVDVGGSMEPPILISRIDPDYPKAAKHIRVQGDVIIEASINREGAVTNTQLVKELLKGIDKAAVNAVRQWKFKPAILNGKPVDSLYKITIRFRPGADSGELAEMVPAAVVAPQSEPPAPAWFDPQILKQRPEVNHVTAALVQLDRATLNPASKQRLKTEIDALQKRLPSLPAEARPAVMLLVAAALEKLGDREATLSYYRDLIPVDGEYGTTGEVRSTEIETSDRDKLEKFYWAILKKPVIEGWFRTSGSWERDTTHSAARLGLVGLRRNGT